MSHLVSIHRQTAAGTSRKNDLSENETQDNVSMNIFKNTLTAFERQVGRGGNTSWQ
jgi:hypothetical protein